MFEYNGEYEIIRESDIPILGICCGHQQLAMAYGYTYASSMGWDDITALENSRTRAKITIERKDPVFEGIPNPFTAVEIHGWAITHLPEDFEVIARSTYIQALRNTERMIYGEQFHAEIKAPYNEGRDYIANFLKMALKKKKKH
jgi:GMP synthase-like glutamine amidotransferase